MGWSPPARPQRHQALSRHSLCPLTSRVAFSDLNLVFLPHLLWEHLFFFFGRSGGSGERLQMSAWRVTDSWSLAHWGSQGCSYYLTGWWPAFPQSFLNLPSRVGHKLWSEWWTESYSSPIVQLFLKSTNIYDKIRELHPSHSSFLINNKV